MYTSTSKSYYLFLTSSSFTHSPLSCPETWEPTFSLHTFDCQPKPTTCNLNSTLLFSILTAIALVQVPISSCPDCCFISYICPRLINFLYHRHSDVIILSLLLKNLQQHIYSTNSLLRYNRLFMFWSLPATTISFLLLLVYSDV